MAAQTTLQIKTKTTAGAPSTANLAAQELCLFSPSTGEFELYANNDDDTSVHLVGVKINRGAGDPTANDDITLGYTRGSVWVNTTDDGIWMCGDNTDTAAVWTEVSAAGGSTFLDNAFQVQDNADNTKVLAFECSGITTGQTRTITVPDFSGTLATIATAQTFSDKTIDNSNTVTLSDALFTLQDNADATKTLVFQLSGQTTSIQGTIATTFTTAKTWTIPDATDTAVGKATTDTFTNKTISDSTNTIDCGTI